MATILITGNNGYIGPILEQTLANAGFDIVGLDTNYFDNCQFYPQAPRKHQIIKDIREVERSDLKGIDAVVHLAALSNDPMGALDEKLTYDINFVASCRLADLCKQAGVRRFVYYSSCSVYGIAESQELTEESPVSPQTAYARSKIDSERYITDLADSSFSPTFLRNATAFGVSPRIRIDLVLNNLVGSAIADGKIRIMSDGSPWRPMVHIEDISLATSAVLRAERTLVHNQIFNVGSEKNNFQIRQMAEAVNKAVRDCSVQYTGEHGKDSRSYHVSFAKIRRVLPEFSPKWNLQLGVQELIQAYQAFGLSSETFHGWRYVRLNCLKWLISNGFINEQLFWGNREQQQWAKAS